MITTIQFTRERRYLVLILLIFSITGISALFISVFFNLNYLILFFIVVSLFLCFVFVLFYLRIQHNIDRKYKRLLDSQTFYFNKLSNDLNQKIMQSINNIIQNINNNVLQNIKKVESKLNEESMEKKKIDYEIIVLLENLVDHLENLRSTTKEDYVKLDTSVIEKLSKYNSKLEENLNNFKLGLENSIQVQKQQIQEQLSKRLEGIFSKNTSELNDQVSKRLGDISNQNSNKQTGILIEFLMEMQNKNWKQLDSFKKELDKISKKLQKSKK